MDCALSPPVMCGGWNCTACALLSLLSTAADIVLAGVVTLLPASMSVVMMEGTESVPPG